MRAGLFQQPGSPLLRIRLTRLALRAGSPKRVCALGTGRLLYGLIFPRVKRKRPNYVSYSGSGSGL